MSTIKQTLQRGILAASLVLAAVTGAQAAEPGFTDHTAQVNGVKLHYQIAGSGSAVVLLHGYAKTGHMWNPVMGDLARSHTVIVPDLRGAGQSEVTADGYSKANMARDIHALVAALGQQHATVVGHDIGLMVAYAYAAQFPQETDRLVLMDAFLPGIGNWKDMWLLRDLWHFHFYGDTPLALVNGRERIYFEHFWNDFAADKTHSVKEADRKIYAAAYAQPGHMRAGFEYFKNFEQDAADFQQLGRTPLTMPVMVLSGEKSGGNFLIEQTKLVATSVDGRIIHGSGHWLMDEAPEQVIPALKQFIQ
ncbi:alpha/beta hydrolase [Rugamonas sp.]|uniref:alpha/beta fold hydrolase n=1 Tax=Rugamonas sp. TaxID=1926287 RepID=UPI0025F8DBBC|nr:alpha/beta hydrolase [Rugamonas sp.]